MQSFCDRRDRLGMFVLALYVVLCALVYAAPLSNFALSHSELVWQFHTHKWHLLLGDGGRALPVLLGHTLALIPAGFFLGISQRAGKPLSYGAGLLLGMLLGGALFLFAFFRFDGISQGLEIITSVIAVLAGMALSRWVDTLYLEAQERLKHVFLALAVLSYCWVLFNTNGVLEGGWLSWEQAQARFATLHLVPFYESYFGAESGRLIPMAYVLAAYAPLGIALFFLNLGRRSTVLIVAVIAAVLEGLKPFLANQALQSENIMLAMLAAVTCFGLTKAITNATPAQATTEVKDHAELPHMKKNSGLRFIQNFIGAGLMVSAFLCAYFHPLFPAGLMAALLGYALLLWWRPELWLIFIPASLPLLAFSSWTGSIYIDEIDSFILMTAGVGFIRILSDPPCWNLARSGKLLAVALAVSYTASAVIGLLPLQPVDLNAFASYSSNFNSLRLFKGFVWAILLLPLLRRASMEQQGHIYRLFIPGILIGCTILSVAAIWERAAFPGLLNFSQDYRITALFSEMHTGGAALDGYLALTLPFVAAWALQRRSFIGGISGAVLFAAMSYTALATFSRGLYLGLALAALLLVLIWASGLMRQQNRIRNPGIIGIGILAGCVLLCGLLVWVFATGGYRVLAAALWVITAIFLLPVVGKPYRAVPFVMMAILLGVFSLALLRLFPEGIFLPLKAPYLAYAASLGLFLTVVGMRWAGWGQGAHVAYASVIWMVFNMLLVAQHWGGVAALPAATGLAVLAGFFIFASQAGRLPVWPVSYKSVSGFGCVAIILGLAIPITGNWYMGQRMAAATVVHDIGTRSVHWRTAASLMGQTLGAQISGIGLGRFPQAYYWQNLSGELPPSFQFIQENEAGVMQGARAGNGNVYLALNSGNSMEPLRYGQRVTILPGRPLVLTMRAKTLADKAKLVIELCDKWLLYPSGCSNGQTMITPGGWQQIRISLNKPYPPDILPRPVQLSFANDSPKTQIMIDDVRLGDGSGQNLVKNGDFTQGNRYWFFSSDHQHLAWHAKNMWLHVWLEQGWAGLILLTFALGVALIRNWRDWRRGNYLAGILAFSLTAFSVVGLFDSLLDVPRITLMFFLMIWLAFMRPVSPERCEAK